MTILTPEAFALLLRACAPDNAPIDSLTRIAAVESHFQTDAVGVNRNGTKDWGLMQINETNFHWLGLTPETVLDPCTNIAAGAKALMAYSAYNTGSPTKGFGNGYVQKVVGATGQPQVVLPKAEPPIIRDVMRRPSPSTSHDLLFTPAKAP